MKSFNLKLILVIFLNSLYILTTFADGLTTAELERFNIKNERTSNLLNSCKELLKNQQYKDVVPFLEEIIHRLSDDPDKSAQKTLAFSIYQLAECNMRLGDYNSAAIGFRNFAENFKNDSLHDLALILSAQNYSLVQNWNDAFIQGSQALQNPLLEEDLKRSALRTISESLFELEQWEDCIQFLEILFRMADNNKDRSDSAVMLVTCFSKLKSFKDILYFLPHCNETARHSLGLNAAILEAGDSFYSDNELLKALILYNNVLPKSDILNFQNRSLLSIRERIIPYQPGSSISLLDHQKIRKDFELEEYDQNKLIQSIIDFPNYDSDLLIRIAQCNHNLGRNILAHTIYNQIIDKGLLSQDDSNLLLSDQAAYLSILSLLDEELWLMAENESLDYINSSSLNKKYLPEVILNLMNYYMRFENYQKAKELTVNLLPDYTGKYSDQIYYMLGYIHFIELNYTDSLKCFNNIIDNYPSSSIKNDALYWRAMSLLFLSKFNESCLAFLDCINSEDFNTSVYYEDAFYRLGISQYGNDLFDKSEKTFLNFVSYYPNHELASEAYSMLGDLRAAKGDLDQSIYFYDKALLASTVVEKINYPFFQKAKIAELIEDYDLILKMMHDYNSLWGSEADLVQSLYWIGKIYKTRDEYPKALQSYLHSIDQYGHLKNMDKVLEYIIDDYNNPDLSHYKDFILDWLNDRKKLAEQNNNLVQNIHYRVLLSLLNINQSKDNDNFLISEDIINIATPISLRHIAERAFEYSYFEIVFAIENRMFRDFPNSKYLLDILLFSIDSRIELHDFNDIEYLSNLLIENYGYSNIKIGYIRKRYADALRLQGDYKNAQAIYNEIIKTREWRGSLTPEILYWLGECYFNQELYNEAFIFFERIYVLYGSYPEWTAKAYLKGMICLNILNNDDAEISKLYLEASNLPELALYPELAEMKEILKNKNLKEYIK